MDGLPLEIYGMVSAIFSLQDNPERVQFFKNTFLLADISIKMVLRISFLSLGNTDVKFTESRKLSQRFYNTAEALPTTNRVELIDKRKFAKIALDKNFKTFVTYVAALKAMPIHPSKIFQVQDKRILVAPQQDKAHTKIPPNYTDYADIFRFNRVIELFKTTNINEYVIKLVEGKQLPYVSIYVLSPVKLETLKTYIKTHLKTEFI